MKATNLVLLAVGAFAAYKLYDAYTQQKKIYDYAYQIWQNASQFIPSVMTAPTWSFNPFGIIQGVMTAPTWSFNPFGILQGWLSGVQIGWGGSSSGGGGFR